MRYLSVFTGAGGFELGLPKDWECVGIHFVEKKRITVGTITGAQGRQGTSTEYVESVKTLSKATKGRQIRRLTPVECERLMSWPDDWTKWGIDEKGKKVKISDSQRYRILGNGVVSSVVHELVKGYFYG